MPAQETKQAAHSLGTPGAGSALDPHRNGMSHGSSPVQRLYGVRPKEGAGSELLGAGPWAGGGGALQSAPCGRGGSGAGGGGPAGGALPAHALLQVGPGGVAVPGAWRALSVPRRNSSGSSAGRSWPDPSRRGGTR